MLTPAQSLTGWLTVFFGALTGVGTIWTAFLDHYNHLPAACVYMKSFVHGVLDRDPPKDPRSIIRIHVEGGSLRVHHIRWESKKQQ